MNDGEANFVVFSLPDAVSTKCLAQLDEETERMPCSSIGPLYCTTGNMQSCRKGNAKDENDNELSVNYLHTQLCLALNTGDAERTRPGCTVPTSRQRQYALVVSALCTRNPHSLRVTERAPRQTSTTCTENRVIGPIYKKICVDWKHAVAPGKQGGPPTPTARGREVVERSTSRASARKWSLPLHDVRNSYEFSAVAAVWIVLLCIS